MIKEYEIGIKMASEELNTTNGSPEAQPARPDPVKKKKGPPEIITAAELQRKEFPPIDWVIPEIMPPGCVLLAGKPKVGKSFLAVNIALSMASGHNALGKFPMEKSEVLVLDLENPARVLQSRLNTHTGGEPAPETLRIAHEWPSLDDGGLDELYAFVERYPKTRLVVVDTLKRIRGRGNSRRNAYDEDYEAVQPLQQFSKETNVSTLVLHHLRKAPAEHDPFDEISGSTGLIGAVDGGIIMRTSVSGGVTLYTRGREIIEKKFAIEFDTQFLLWRFLGEAAKIEMSDSRKRILEAIVEFAITTPKEIATVLEMNENTVRRLMMHMQKDGQLVKMARGEYRLPILSNNADSIGATPF